MLYEVPILAYHDIGKPRQYPGGDRSPAVSKDSFIWQIEYLIRNRYNVISLDGLLGAQRHFADRQRRRVVLTFDDGFDNFYTDAYPVLRRYGLCATLFVVADYIGQTGWLTKEQLKELADNGVTIGSHTKSHCYLPSLQDEEIKTQVIESKRLLEALLERQVNIFCYPNGGFTPAIQEIVRSAGYKAAVTTNRSLGWGCDRYAIRRIKMTDNSSKPYAMWAKLSGYYSWIKRKHVAAQERGLL